MTPEDLEDYLDYAPCDYYEPGWLADCGRRSVRTAWRTRSGDLVLRWRYCSNHRWALLVWLNKGGYRVENLPQDQVVVPAA
jgi:hypothetical protein